MALRVLHAEPQNFAADARRAVESFAALDERQASRDHLFRLLPEYDVPWVCLGHRVDKEVLAHDTKLKAIVTATTGLDHIDLSAAAAHGLEVLSSEGRLKIFQDRRRSKRPGQNPTIVASPSISAAGSFSPRA